MFNVALGDLWSCPKASFLTSQPLSQLILDIVEALMAADTAPRRPFCVPGVTWTRRAHLRAGLQCTHGYGEVAEAAGDGPTPG